MLKRSGLVLIGVVGVLWIQFFLRAHNPTQQAFFIDEHRHIERAAAISEGGHPAAQSHGKFLLYVWLAPFKSEPTVALHISRSAVALFSLIGTAGLFALMKRLFGISVGFIAIVFYAFLPFTVFYERMVLADGIAAVFGMLTAWQSVRLAIKPTYGRSIWVGLMTALAVMAKLTMTFSTVLMPMMAILLLGSHLSVTGPNSDSLFQNAWIWAKKRIRHYWWYLFAAGVTFITAWLPTLIPGAIVAVRGGEYYVLVDQSLIDTTVLTGNERYGEFFNQIETMLWLPMVVVLSGAISLGLWKLPRYTGFALGWLLLIWIPNLLIVWQTKTRYLMPGMYAVAMILGIGLIALGQTRWKIVTPKRQERLIQGLVGGFILIWIIVFALPFDWTASNHPTLLDLPLFDQRDYFQHPWNAYGLLPSLDYLAEHGEVGEDGKVHIVGVNWLCDRLELYDLGNVDLDCIAYKYDGSQDGEQLQTIVAYLKQTTPLYLIVEQDRDRHEFAGSPYANSVIEWQQLAAFRRPMNGYWITVWRASRVD